MNQAKLDLIKREGVDISDAVVWRPDEEVIPILEQGEEENQAYIDRYGQGAFLVFSLPGNGKAKLLGNGPFIADLWRLAKAGS